ncbi:MAG: MetQ/NlpA family ABC transporter substrate-binding protein [Firmicutes bacterium]|nr:MetQ/NlpA family ABC transporter substrate-binding protein [Bacillota bacterium]
MKLVSRILVLVLMLSLLLPALALAEPVTVKIGVVGENNEQWDVISKALKAEGIEIELVRFSDYSLPNQALADGEIGLNAFQHYAFLENQKQSLGLDLIAIGETLIAPLGLYSKKISGIEELKEGDKIALPNDATNEGRALKILESAGLIAVDPDAGYLPELSDITQNDLNLEFVEVEAAQTAGLLPDVAAAFINGGHAVDNGYYPATDAILLETVKEGSDNPYINIIAARTDDKDNEVYKKIVEAYHTDAVAEIFATTYKGAYLPAWK